MIAFIERTWFFWWIVAVLVILRWFHIFSSQTDERAHEASDSGTRESSTDSNQIPSGTASHLFT
jgi:hypothetical protein